MAGLPGKVAGASWWSMLWRQASARMTLDEHAVDKLDPDSIKMLESLVATCSDGERIVLHDNTAYTLRL
jgi:hypothetical protein